MFFVLLKRNFFLIQNQFIFLFFHFCEKGENNSDAGDNVGFVSAGLTATRYPLDGADIPSVRNVPMFSS